MAILILTALLGISMCQVSSERASTALELKDRKAVSDVAQQFVLAIINYDYAHPDVQRLRVSAVSSSAVAARVRETASDVAFAKAASLGDVTGLIVTMVTGDRAEVLANTSQVFVSAFATPGTQFAGLMDVVVTRIGGGWTVTDYRWLLAPTEQP